MRRPTAILLALLLLTGCSSNPPQESRPTPTPAPPVVARPTPTQPATIPAGAPAVEPYGTSILIRGVQPDYYWFAGGQRLAIATQSGLWSLAPDGSGAEWLAPAHPRRHLVGAWGDGIAYIEREQDELVAYLVRPGQPPYQIGRLPHPGVGAPGYPLWATLSRSRLIIAIEGRLPVAIDLESGQVTDLGEESLPVQKGELALSPNGLLLAYKLANRGDRVAVLDLQRGTLSRLGEGEAHLPGVAWDALSRRWAVRAAEPDSGLPIPIGANLEEGATHIDLVDGRGEVRHLQPPFDLELLAGPWWSQSGQWLAVVTGAIRWPEVPQRLWTIDLATGEWRWLATLPLGSWVAGFAPDDRSLMLYTDGGLQLYPVTGGEPLPVAHPWPADPSLRQPLPDGSLLYLTAGAQPSLLLRSPAGEATVLLADERPKERLTVQEGYAALIRVGEGLADDLIILPLVP